MLNQQSLSIVARPGEAVKPTLREYQVEAIESTASLYKEARRVIMALPTGTGKTVIATEVVRRAAARGNKVRFITDRIVLAEQTSKVFDAWGIEHGFMQGGNLRDLDANVVICNAQTLESKHDRNGGWNPDGLVIIDEAHTQRQFVEDCLLKADKARVLGLTATPERAGIGNFYQAMYSKPTNWFIANGYLCPYEIIGPGARLTGARAIRSANGRRLSGPLARRPSRSPSASPRRRTWPTLSRRRGSRPRRSTRACATPSAGLS